MKRSGPRKDTQAVVKWEEVWHWSEQIRKRWGYWCVVIVSPPIPGKEGIRFTITVDLQILDAMSGKRGSKMWQSRNVERIEATAESVALQLVSGMFMRLDREEDEAERAALEAGALL